MLKIMSEVVLLPANTDRLQHVEDYVRAEGDANIFGAFRVKNHDLTPTNYISSNCGGRRENFWGISCEKSYFCPILGGRAPGAAPLPPGFCCLLSFTRRANERFSQVWLLKVCYNIYTFICVNANVNE